MNTICSKNIINQIRAFAPKPGAWFNLNKERIKIIDAKKGKHKGKVSTILNESVPSGFVRFPFCCFLFCYLSDPEPFRGANLAVGR